MRCPKCQSQYVVRVLEGVPTDEVELGVSAPYFRCLRCQHVWADQRGA